MGYVYGGYESIADYLSDSCLDYMDCGGGKFRWKMPF